MEASSSGLGRCLLHVKGTFSKAPRSIAWGQGAVLPVLHFCPRSAVPLPLFELL